MTTLERVTDTVFVLDIGTAGEDDGSDHRFDPLRIGDVTAALDQVEASVGPAALVTTATGKFYSNGLEPARFTGPDVAAYLGAFNALLARMLTLELPTIAALNGHTYAGGLLFALAHDERQMRADRGFVCLPEVVIGFPFPSGMGELVQARLAPTVAHQAMVLGRRYDGAEALAAGIVDRLAPRADLLTQAVERAEQLAPLRGQAVATIKRSMYSDALDLLLDRAVGVPA